MHKLRELAKKKKKKHVSLLSCVLKAKEKKVSTVVFLVSS